MSHVSNVSPDEGQEEVHSSSGNANKFRRVMEVNNVDEVEQEGKRAFKNEAIEEETSSNGPSVDGDLFSFLMKDSKPAANEAKEKALESKGNEKSPTKVNPKQTSKKASEPTTGLKKKKGVNLPLEEPLLKTESSPPKEEKASPLSSKKKEEEKKEAATVSPETDPIPTKEKKKESSNSTSGSLAEVELASLPKGEVSPSFSLSTPSAGYTHFSAEFYELFEKIVGALLIQQYGGKTVTTLELSIPNSVLNGVRVEISHVDTAVRSFNIQFFGTEEANAKIEANLAKLQQELQTNQPHLTIRFLKPALLTQKKSFPKKPDHKRVEKTKKEH